MPNNTLEAFDECLLLLIQHSSNASSVKSVQAHGRKSAMKPPVQLFELLDKMTEKTKQKNILKESTWNI
jgi:hypothetical protein